MTPPAGLPSEPQVRQAFTKLAEKSRTTGTGPSGGQIPRRERARGIVARNAKSRRDNRQLCQHLDIMRYRDDKSPAEADTIDTVRALYGRGS